MEKFYLTQKGQPVGPWSVQEILRHLSEQNLTWTDYLYDEAKRDWVLLLDHPVLLPHFREMAQAPKAAPSKGAKPNPQPKPVVAVDWSSAKEKEWFALRGDNKYGPFAMVDVIKMLQDKQIFEYDYVWNVRYSSWKRIAECEELRPEKVKMLHESGHPEVSEVFFRRRHARAQYGASIVVHNNKQVWRGESIEISSGGCGLLLENSDFTPGQTLFLHFKVGDGVPPFNATCEIVSKQTLKSGSSACKYGVRFTNVSRDIQLAIKDYTQKAA